MSVTWPSRLTSAQLGGLVFALTAAMDSPEVIQLVSRCWRYCVRTARSRALTTVGAEGVGSSSKLELTGRFPRASVPVLAQTTEDLGEAALKLNVLGDGEMDEFRAMSVPGLLAIAESELWRQISPAAIFPSAGSFLSHRI
jgi:hypothetical protein